MQSTLQNIPTNLPPLGDNVTNSDTAIGAFINEDDARDSTVTRQQLLTNTGPILSLPSQGN